MGLLLAVLGLSFLIFFHELGHFLFARLFGVKVLIFSIGFGKKLFTWNYKDTQYALSIIPLGGYVKLKGEDKDSISKDSETLDDSKYTQDSLTSKHPLKRIVIFLAGPLFNFIFAFMVYVCLFANGVTSYSDKAIVGDIGKEFGAYNILQKYDEILSVNDIKIEKFSDISPAINKENTHNNTAKLIVSRNTQLDNTKIDSVKSNQNGKIIELIVPLSMQDNKMILGITPLAHIVYFSPIEILQKATIMVYDNMLIIYKGIRDILFGLIGIENLSGVIGIADVSAKAYNVGFINFILVLALISVNLGVINLLPIPIVDGGQILFTVYEWLTGRMLYERIANMLVLLGLSIIISLMLLGFYNDIMRLTT